MAGINGLGGVFIPQTPTEDVDTPLPFSQIVPARSAALPSLQSVQSGALEEAMESMSLVMGSRLRHLDRRQEGKNRSGALSDRLAAWVGKVSGPALDALMAQYSQLGSGEHSSPLDVLQDAGLAPGVMALLLAGLLQEKGMPAGRRRRLEAALEALLADESLSVDMFAWLESGEITRHSLIPVRMLYERSRQGEDTPESLLAWYQEVCDWPEREVRLKILIRALAQVLGVGGDPHQMARIADTLQELKRLLLFFSMAEHSAWVARAGGMEPEKMLREALHLLSELWVYADSIADRPAFRDLPLPRQIAWTRAMLVFIRTLPSLCFRDDEHQNQIMEALEQLQDRLAEAE